MERLNGLPIGSSPEKDYRRFSLAPKCKQGAEISIGREQNAIFVFAQRKNLLVFGCMQCIITNVRGIVANLPKSVCHNRR
jgi:hypothetical protein